MRISITIIILLFLTSCTINKKYMSALYLCNKNEIIAEINKGADVNQSIGYSGFSAIHCAVRNGDLEFVKWLDSKGANMEAATYKEATPIYFSSVSDKKLEITSYLIEKGVDVNVRSIKGGTPLLMSTRFEANETAKLLVKHGADISYKDPFRGFNALMWAKHKNNEVLIKYFNSIMNKKDN